MNVLVSGSIHSGTRLAEIVLDSIPSAHTTSGGPPLVSITHQGRLRCPVCQAEEVVLLRLGVREDPSRPVFKCAKCGLAYLAPPDDVEVYYTSDAYRRTHNPVPGRAMTPAERFAAMRSLMGPRVAQFMRHVPTDARVLDFGCSSGFFLEALVDAGFRDVHGLDLNLADVAFAASRGLNVWPAGDAVSVPEQPDAISACHVVEHLERPREWARWAQETLAPGGCAYVEVPNADDELLRTGGPRFADFYYREPHLTYFGAEQLLRLLLDAGFASVHIEYRQEYSLANAMHWTQYGRPQEHAALAQGVPADPLLRRLDRQYREELEAAGRADCIVAVAWKGGAA